MDTVPDLGALSDDELKKLIDQLTDEEQEVSYQRRLLHGRIDILRAELVNRLRKKHQDGESTISGADVQQLTDILSGKASPEGAHAAVDRMVDAQDARIASGGFIHGVLYDNPSGTASDPYTISVQVADDETGDDPDENSK